MGQLQAVCERDGCGGQLSWADVKAAMATAGSLYARHLPCHARLKVSHNSRLHRQGVIPTTPATSHSRLKLPTSC